MFNENMPYRSLGASGLKVSQFSLGGWTTYGGTVKDTVAIQSIIDFAYNSGINYYDSADIYAHGENEKVMGEALKKYPRNELVLASKVFWPMSDDPNNKGLSRKHIFESIHASLKRFKTDYLDIYYCHRFDVETPLIETIRAMDDLIHQGKILYWGTSEWTRDQLLEAHNICNQYGYYKPVVEQPQYNLLTRKIFEKYIGPTASDLRMGVAIWSPLASGMLTGKYDSDVKSGRLSEMNWLRETLYTVENVRKVRELKTVSDELNISRTQLSLAWAAHNQHVSTVILGATKLEQLKENLGALDVKLDSNILKKINHIFEF